MKQSAKNRSSVNSNVRINEAIRSPELRIIDAEGKQLGVKTRSEALEMANEAGVDLVEISPNADPPVAKIIDWGKYQYQKMKEARKSKNKAGDMKQMRFGLKIGQGDLETKLRKIRKFLESGHTVRIQIFFRGREMAHREIGYEMIDRILKMLEDDAKADGTPQMAGRNLSITIRSK